MANNKKLLYEISIIRPVVILLLVVLHSFCIYKGSWPYPEGIDHVLVYDLFAKYITGFRIETIAFVAGYVFAFQSITLSKKHDFTPFAYKKFKRLIIPGLIFSLLYYFCFKFDSKSFGQLGWFMDLTNGFGHLWFLPMLFWCFIAIWCIDRFNLSSRTLFIILAILSIFKMPNMIFGFTKVFHFTFYCYLGYVVYKHKQELLSKLSRTWYIVFFWALYSLLGLVQLFARQYFKPYLEESIALLIACSGIMALYLLVSKFTEKPGFTPPKWVIDSSKLCYGVYIFHQFILIYLLYHTSLPQITGKYLLPWIALAITLPLSIIMTKLSLKTKIGRFLMG